MKTMEKSGWDSISTQIEARLEEATEESLREVSIILSNTAHAAAFTSGYIAGVSDAKKAVREIVRMEK